MVFSRDSLKLICLSVILLIGFFTWYSDVFDILSALYALKDYRGFLVFFLLSTVSVLSLAIAPFIRSRLLKYAILLIFLVSLIIESSAISIYGDNISVQIFSDLLLNVNEVKFGFLTYLGLFLKHILFWTVLFVPLFFRSKLTLNSYVSIVPLAALAGSYVYTEQNANLREFSPSNTSVLSRLIVASQLKNPDVERKRDALGPQMTADGSGYKNIVVVIDESVRSDYLQLNGYGSDNSPFLSGRNDLINFGNAVSYANCSAGSRVAIRSMAKEIDFPDPDYRVLKQPTFWQYAKRAGYETIYIDGWLQIRPRHSLLTTDELTYVDTRTSASLVPFPSSDQRIANLVKDLLKRDGKKFIFVEKIGLHAPYDMNIPNPGRLERKFVVRPELSARQNELIHEYVEGIFFQVDKFFETLIGSEDLKDTIILYTSDHGQAMFDGKYEATHCTRKDTVKGEGLVPMFAFASENALRADLARSAALHSGKASHFDLPATFLRLMGFPAEQVQPGFGGGLFEINQNRKRRFFSGNPFMKTAVWTNVDD